MVAEALKGLVITQESKTNPESAAWAPTLDAYCESMVRARDAAALFIADMEAGKKPRWLTLLGMPGTGKTMIGRQMIERSRKSNPGRLATWMSGRNAGDAERNPRPYCVTIDASAFGRKLYAGNWDEPEAYFNDHCILFDDLGAQRDKDGFIANGIYRFANSRLGKWTIWTSNFTLVEISERIDPRVTSRLIRDENRLVTIDAKDYALTGRYKG